MENLELVEPSFLPCTVPVTPLMSSHHTVSKSPPPSTSAAGILTSRCAGCREPALHFTPLSWATGWGSTSATDSVLSNLFYITVQFASEHSDSLRKVWQSLCNSFHDNCAIILRFLLQMTAISSRCAKLLAAAKSIVAFVAKGSKDHVISFLLDELSYIDAIPTQVKKSSSAPFFHVVSGSTTSSSSSHSKAKAECIVHMPPINLSTATSTMPAPSTVSHPTSASSSSNKDRHSTLPPDFYQSPTP